MPLTLLREFIKLESASGIVLFTAALLALILANSPWHEFYELIFSIPIVIQLGNFQLSTHLINWINDGLMTIFFLLVSLEIKRELLEGELNTRKKALLPGIAAIGGMIMPAIIYIIFNITDHNALRGWAIPTATDIAFSLGILTLLGNRTPTSLKIFLTALAILDDLGAIIIIALFYTAHIALLFLILAIFCALILIILNRLGVNYFWPYALIGIALWICTIKSGIHATIAGVILGFAIPLQVQQNKGQPLLRKLEHKLHPWVAFGILPLFALANAGLSFSNLHWSNLFIPLPFGIILGLFLGKQIGIFCASWIAIKTGFAHLPSRANWKQFYGVSLICGIGFTMSLFIGDLAFPTSTSLQENFVRLGVMVGSVISGIMGYLILRTTKTP